MGAATDSELFGIIEKCREFGVSRLKTSKFEVELHPWREVKAGYEAILPQDVETPKAIDRELMDDIRMSQLMIDDPFGFEKEVIIQENRRFINEDSGHSRTQ